MMPTHYPFTLRWLQLLKQPLSPGVATVVLISLCAMRKGCPWQIITPFLDTQASDYLLTFHDFPFEANFLLKPQVLQLLCRRKVDLSGDGFAFEDFLGNPSLVFHSWDRAKRGREVLIAAGHAFSPYKSLLLCQRTLPDSASLKFIQLLEENYCYISPTLSDPL